VAREVLPSGPGSVALTRWRHLFHRRSVTSAQLAGRARTESAGVDRKPRASPRVYDCEVVVGIRPYARRSNGSRPTRPWSRPLKKGGVYRDNHDRALP